jgi:hypothetical protein
MTHDAHNLDFRRAHFFGAKQNEQKCSSYFYVIRRDLQKKIFCQLFTLHLNDRRIASDTMIWSYSYQNVIQVQ